MKIRPATRDDIPRIVEMAQRFYPQSPYPALYGPMPDEQAAGLAIITMEGVVHEGVELMAPGVLLVGEVDGEVVGMLSLHADRACFNPERRIASELVFWIEPEHRGGLAAVRFVKAGEAAAKAIGIEVIRMAALSTSPPETAQLYAHLGYAPTETYFSKRL